ncbi:hypothetical protein PENTCL1PPCAC_9493, partial [Pristionchus entomophagus]
VFSRWGTESCERRRTGLTLRSIILSNSDTGTSSTRFPKSSKLPPPALFTRTSSLPNFSTVTQINFALKDASVRSPVISRMFSGFAPACRH